MNVPGMSLKYEFPIRPPAAHDSGAGANITPAIRYPPPECTCNGLIIHNSGFPYQQAPKARGVRFMFLDLFGTKPFQTGKPVCFTSAVQLFKPRKLLGHRSDNYLSASLVGNTLLFTKSIHLLAAFGA
jgi:hypothetical protein